MYFFFFSDGESTEFAVELTDLRDRHEAVKPRLIKMQQRLMLYSDIGVAGGVGGRGPGPPPPQSKYHQRQKVMTT